MLAEKQDDTADMLLYDNGYYDIIDAKTTQASKKAQPPNIISALKVAKMCAVMLKHQDFNSVDIHYVSVDWIEKGNELSCTASTYKSLFLINPSDLYINWAAALQIQFHPQTIKQDFKGTRQQWAQAYLKHFTQSASDRIEKMRVDFIEQFRKYIE